MYICQGKVAEKLSFVSTNRNVLFFLLMTSIVNIVIYLQRSCGKSLAGWVLWCFENINPRVPSRFV